MRFCDLGLMMFIGLMVQRHYSKAILYISLSVDGIVTNKSTGSENSRLVMLFVGIHLSYSKAQRSNIYSVHSRYIVLVAIPNSGIWPVLL